MFLRNRSRGRDTWSLVLLGIVLCGVSVLGLTGAFGELGGGGGSKLHTIVLFGVPLGLVAIGGGIVNAFRGGSDPREGDGDDDRGAPAPPGGRSGLPRPDGTDTDGSGPAPTRPDGMIDR